MSQSLSRRAFFKGAASTFAVAGAASAYLPAIAAPKDAFIEGLIAKMSLEEKAGQLSLYSDSVRTEAAFFNPTIASQSKDQVLADIAAGKITGLFNGRGVALSRELQKVAVEKSPHGIPLIFAADIIHGMTTIFPIPMAEAASFDPELSRRTNRAAAVEATANAIHWTFSPAVDVVRDQRWGRSAEAAGEDTWLACQFATARVQGFQGPALKAPDSMLACLKHFAAYGAVEAGIDYNTVEITEPTLRQTHLPSFKAGIDAGALTVMSAFNDIGGVPSTGNRRLLTDILRGEMGFKGFVVSDFTSEEELIAHGFAADGRDAAKKALLAGCDMSMQSGIYMKYLPELVRSGEVPKTVLDEAVRRVLRIKKAIGLFDDPYKSMDAARERNDMRRPETIALAREAARRACVLLKNDNDVLPLKKSGQKVALIGPLAADRNQLNGYWVVFPDTKDSVTVEMAMRGVIGDSLTVTRGSDIDAPIAGGIEAAVKAAKAADVVVLCIGEGQEMSGEAQSRTEITVPDAQMALAEAVKATGKPVVVLLSHGRAIALEGAVRDADAILCTWFLGSEAGNGIADLLFGDYSPSGRLPCSFPLKSGQEPFYYNHRTTGRPQIGDDASYRARWRDAPFAPLYPFGHGLGYGKVHYGATQLSAETLPWSGKVTASVEVRNAGSRPLHEVAQLYIHDRVASITQPVRSLKGIRHLDLKAGETQTVSFELSHADLAFVGLDMKWQAEPGEFNIWIAPSSAAGIPAKLTLLKA
ncbi:beta-glucosidase BglX [Asticcacaulis taihuensis]|uniref:beta-glucosidase BglX n=1 Tax=Asticcacaulis taihuensis TaxID=260084 RepID=UPI003F68FB62